MPGNKQLFLLVIVSIQACLLDFGYAKRLRIAGKSIISGLHSNDSVSTHGMSTQGVTVPPSNVSPPCGLPYNNLQLKFYATDRFNNSIMSYALKAMEIDRKMTEREFTAEDNARNNAIIANITDHSRFTPAGMDLNNKVVCAKILQDLDVDLGLHSSTALCDWDYICDYRADRFPNYLFKARCKTSRCHHGVNSRYAMCQSSGIHVAVLQRRECREWIWAEELLPISCHCTCGVISCTKTENDDRTTMHLNH